MNGYCIPFSHRYQNLVKVIEWLLVQIVTPPDIILGSGQLAKYIYHLHSKDHKTLLLCPLASSFSSSFSFSFRKEREREGREGREKEEEGENLITTNVPSDEDLTIMSSICHTDKEKILEIFHLLFKERVVVNDFTSREAYCFSFPFPGHNDQWKETRIPISLLMVQSGEVVTLEKRFKARHIILAENWDPLVCSIALNSKNLYYQGTHYHRCGNSFLEKQITQEVILNYTNVMNPLITSNTSDPLRDAFILAYCYYISSLGDNCNKRN